jgi:hypothetical protein
MWTYNGLRKREGRVWTDNNGTMYPSQWWSRTTKEEKEAKGLVWVDDPVQYDSRFYTGDGTPKVLEDVSEEIDGETVVTKGLKSKAIDMVKAQAAGLLNPTDWMVIKAAEVDDYSVPAEITTYRAAVRTASNDIETSITNAADLDAFMALYNVPVDAEGVPTGNAPINDWPDEV